MKFTDTDRETNLKDYYVWRFYVMDKEANEQLYWKIDDQIRPITITIDEEINK
jgi:hypothetical protein